MKLKVMHLWELAQLLRRMEYLEGIRDDRNLSIEQSGELNQIYGVKLFIEDKDNAIPEDRDLVVFPGASKVE